MSGALPCVPPTVTKHKSLPIIFRFRKLLSSRTRPTDCRISAQAAAVTAHCANVPFTTSEKVSPVISSLKDRKRPGPDNIDVKFLKILPKNLLPFLQRHQHRDEAAIVSVCVKTCNGDLHSDSWEASTATLLLSAFPLLSAKSRRKSSSRDSMKSPRLMSPP